MQPSDPWRPLADGLCLCVRLTPRAARDALEGVAELSDGRRVLRARVRAVPDAGRANDALIRLLADELCIPGSRIRLVDGATSRLKVLFIGGDAQDLVQRLRDLLG